MTARQIAERVRAGESAVEVTRRALAAASATEGAFAFVAEDYALAQAERIDSLGASERARLPLAGVPVPIKDLNEVAGLPFQAGSRLLADNISSVDDGVVVRLKEAGAIIIGKTITPEFGFAAYSEDGLGRAARTPFDSRRTAGGSSGGAALAVAAGVCPIAQGSDGGGSLRIPAAACSVVGMKPSRGVVSAGPAGTAGPGLATNGAVAATVADSALALDVLRGPWPGDTFFPPADDYRDRAGSYLAACSAEVPKLRVGVLTDPLNVDEVAIHPEALAARDKVRAWLEELGHDTVEISRPITTEQWNAFRPIWEGMAASLPIPPGAEDQLTGLVAHLRRLGQGRSGAEYAQSLSALQANTRQISRAFAGLDLVLTPTLSGPPPFPRDLVLPDPEEDWIAQCTMTPWTAVWNMTGWASMSLPVHVADIEGVPLPFGAMISATGPGQDGLLFALAAKLEPRYLAER
ncbi:MAG: amidase [Flaviflexus sp.]|nr:amidase [Flaviflexus sp.]